MNAKENYYQTADDGTFQLPVSNAVDAILFYHDQHHIAVKAIPRDPRVPRDPEGRPDLKETIEMYSMKDESSDYGSSSLRFSQIAHEYEKLALLAFTTDELTRRFIDFEFDRMQIVERLEDVELPSRAPERLQAYLTEMRDRILKELRGKSGGRRKK